MTARRLMRLTLSITLGFIALGWFPRPGCGSETTVDYLRDIKPILLKHCSTCHGGLKQHGGLRLDTGAAMIRGGESGAAITPGQVEDSFLLQVLRGEAGFTMPPEGEGTPLSEAEVMRIEHWVREGADVPQEEKPQADPKTWWSYQPLKGVDVPEVRDAAWIRNEVDSFVRAQQEARGLRPQSDARPEVLLRRLYLDLIGLPPTREELTAFAADPSEIAYEAAVDDLLARPQYGERWGRHWMDVWRYSDWYGRRPSNEIRYSQRHIWRWRDWIIRSLNEDKGYDQMLVEMLAGDEVAPTDNGVLAATGFLGRNWYKFDRNTWLFETVEQTSRGLMAMTMQCCRCHDHKYDPVSQKEYYQFRAIFEPHGFRTDALASNITEFDNGKEKVLQDGLSRAFDEEPGVATYLFMRGDDRRPDTDHPLQPQVPASLGRKGLSIEPVSLPPESYVPQISEASLRRAMIAGEQAVASAKAKRDGIRQEIDRLQEQVKAWENSDVAILAKPFIDDEFDSIDPETWKVIKGTWETKDGRLIQSEVTSFSTMVSLRNHPRNFVAKARYRKLRPGQYRSIGFSFDYVNGGKDSQDVYTSKSDSNPRGGVQAFHRKGGRQVYPPDGIRQAEIKVGEWIDLEFEVRETNLTIRLNGDVKLEYALPLKRVDGKFAVWVHTGAAEFERLSVTPVVPSVADLRSAITAARHRQRLAELAIEVAEAEADFRRDQIHAERARLGATPTAGKSSAVAASRSERRLQLLKCQIEVATAERELSLSDTPENQKQLEDAQAKLGAALDSLSKADGAYTQLTSEYPRTSTGRRLALARWLTRPDHPRTARVAVNQIWMRHMGEPIVPSVDNFGLSGQEPTHPRLLDWLSRQLVTNNWSMKHLHKLIVMSSTYRQSSLSGMDNPNLQNDRDNRYLWRAHSKRMEAEVVRDSLLAVSGELDATTGGPDIDEQQGQTSRRRSLYFRTTPDNQMQMLALFDQASPDECYRRRESVIPQQALALMNSRLAIDLSRQLAAKLSKNMPSDDANADAMFIRIAVRTILSREATDEDVRDCQEFLRESRQILAQQAELQAFSATSAKAAVPPSSDPGQRARESLIHVLFNHNDFVTIR